MVCCLRVLLFALCFAGLVVSLCGFCCFCFVVCYVVCVLVNCVCLRVWFGCSVVLSDLVFGELLF